MRWVPSTIAALVALHPVAEAHYTCASDEVVGEVQGETGSVCGPRCTEGANDFECPADVPTGTTAQPQCILQDVDSVAYCGLLCQTDAQCPSGASCKKVPSSQGQSELSICLHSLSFNEWAKTGARKKLAVGMPARAGQSAKGLRIAKAFAALQNLKKRYGIQDGDADVLVFKEFLSAASTSAFTPSAAGAPGSSAFGISPAAAMSSIATNAQATVSQGGGFFSWLWSWIAPWSQEVTQFEGYMKDGVSGVQREAHDIVWNIEHINQRGKAEELLRGVIMIVAVYLIVGCGYKYQTQGARGVEMIPNIGFWNEYPILVGDGVRYLLILVGYSKENVASSGGTGFTTIGSDRDSIANWR
eukprot:TRINITY_DN52002_c0_g1_i1.p1 TRINITY_DN52002_c0_g1~~TRINITY_DN52002_c0_g1_i1.p1  ORF type:complete len:358 (-),score=65.56 TRINITY_DN52002_c0_g1_i1:47-1120(-)